MYCCLRIIHIHLILHIPFSERIRLPLNFFLRILWYLLQVCVTNVTERHGRPNRIQDLQHFIIHFIFPNKNVDVIE